MYGIPTRKYRIFRQEHLSLTDGKIMELEVRSLFTNYEEGEVRRFFFYGSKGWMHLGGSSFKVYLGTENEKGPSMKESDLELEKMTKPKLIRILLIFLIA